MEDIDKEDSDIPKWKIVDDTILFFYYEKLYEKYANKREDYSAKQMLEEGYTMRDIKMMA